LPFQVIPREQRFFDLFERSAADAAAAARVIVDLAGDVGNAEAYSSKVREFEHDGDEATREVMATLNTTFVPPFDREDIYRLATSLDDVLDSLWAVADLVVLHRIEEALPVFRQLADVTARAATVVVRTVARLRVTREVNGDLIEINRLENEGDRLYRRAVADLFSGDFKAMDVLKWRDILDQIEQALDGCEDIANVIESITLKHD